MKGERYTTEEKIGILREADKRGSHRGSTPGAQPLAGNLPPLEAAIWANGGEGGPPIEGPRAGERRAEEDAG